MHVCACVRVRVRVCSIHHFHSSVLHFLSTLDFHVRPSSLSLVLFLSFYSSFLHSLALSPRSHSRSFSLLLPVPVLVLVRGIRRLIIDLLPFLFGMNSNKGMLRIV